MMRVTLGVVASWLCLSSAAAEKWVQDVFGISDWVAPQPDGRDTFPNAFDAEAEKRYAEYVLHSIILCGLANQLGVRICYRVDLSARPLSNILDRASHLVAS